MSQYVEFIAKNTEEALARASEHFGLTLNRLEWEVVEAGSAGLFGLIGAKKAKVKVRPAAGSMAEEMAALAAVVSQDVRPRGKEPAQAEPKPELEPKLESRPEPRPEPATAPPAAPAEVPAPQPRPSLVPAEVPAAPAPSAAPAPPDDEEVVEELEEEAAAGEEAELEEHALEASDEDEGPLGEDEEEDEGASGEARLETDPATIERAREVLARLIQPLDPLAQVEARGGAQGIVLEIGSKEAGVLIGRRGQHLEALQYIATRIVSHQAGRPVRLSVDAGGYRQRRREALEELAQRAAAKAKGTGKSVSIGPLSAPERRVVHMTLKGEPGVTTASRGRGELKKVIVSTR